jgi:signal transduction histidine kinase
MKSHSTDETMSEYISSSEKTAMRLKELSDDMFRYLLVFGDSAQPCELEPYDCATLIEQLLSEHIVLLRENGYEVRFTSDDAADVSILTSAPELMRIIDNMFSNIRKYADKSSPVYISTTIEDDAVTIGFSNRIAKDSVLTESTGIGLKTCAKIAEIISCDFSYTKGDGVFESYIRLKTQRSEKV